MKYSDERDRITTPGLSRRQFLGFGGQHAARLAAGVFLRGAEERLVEESVEESETETDQDPAGGRTDDANA